MTQKTLSITDFKSATPTQSELERLSPEERIALFDNLCDTAYHDDVELARLRRAANTRDEFKFAVWVNCLCRMCGWRFSGYGQFDPTGVWEDDLIYCSDLEWFTEGGNDLTVRVQLGDQCRLLVADDGNEWREIEIADLVDVLVESRNAHNASPKGDKK